MKKCGGPKIHGALKRHHEFFAYTQTLQNHMQTNQRKPLASYNSLKTILKITTQYFPLTSYKSL